MVENVQEQPILNQQQSQRKLDPRDILLPPGYKIEVFATGLTKAINLTFTGKGEMNVADSGITDENGYNTLQLHKNICRSQRYQPFVGFFLYVYY